MFCEDALFQVGSEIWTTGGGGCADQGLFKWVRHEGKHQSEGRHDSFIPSASIHWGDPPAGLCFRGCENNAEERWPFEIKRRRSEGEETGYISNVDTEKNQGKRYHEHP